MWEPPQRLVDDSLLASADAAADKIAIVDEFTRESYAGLSDLALRFARLLQDEKLERGDRVALYLDNTVQCAAAIFGTLVAGGVFVVVNPQTKAEKLRFILDDSGARFLLTEHHSTHIVEEALAGAAEQPVVFSTTRDDRSSPFAQLDDALASVRPSPSERKTIPPDLAALVYTSGTMGRPKAVMMSHQALVFVIGSIGEYLGLDADDTILSVLPLSFTYGLSQLLLAARLQATLVLERSFAFPARTLQRLEAEQATVFPGVPTIWATLLAMERAGPFTSVRCVTNAAAALPPTFHDGIQRIFPNAHLYRMYGQTECMRVCYLEPDLVPTKPSSVGRAIPGTEVFVLGEDGRPVSPGSVGVLHVRGPHVTMGYWRDAELTDHVLKEGRYPGERMLCTHDEFTVDEDGDLYFVARTDDVIKTRGEKVGTAEVENALHEIDGIRQAAVAGVPDELLGEAIRAYVVRDDDVALSEADVIARARLKLENFMVPKEVVFVPELPHTDSGKVDRARLRDDAWARAAVSRA